MNFATFDFAIFMVVVYLPYLVLPHRSQNYLLLVASYFFYGYWDWRFLSLLLISTLVNYVAALAIHYTDNTHRRNFYLVISVIINLGLLAFFKYLGFFVETMADLLRLIGLQPNLPVLNIILPVGISFYTFQTMSYTIDVYLKKLSPTWDFWDFALFHAFFPQLVAGPIERAVSLLPQIQQPRVVTYDQVSRGAFLILWGLFKKIVIADGVAGAVETVYGMTTAQPTAMDIVLASYLFTLQIYCDFSGYSDVARGTAKLMGFELVTNFNLPLLATSPRDFWQRWHMSLVTWLRDYLYIPLGGSRQGEWKTLRNIMITIFLSGFWHGAAWNFILWGIYQGILVCLNHLWFMLKHITPPKASVRRVLTVKKIIQIILFFQLIAYSFMLFRAVSLHQIVSFTKTLLIDFNFHTSAHFSLPVVTLLSIPLLLGLEVFQYVTNTPNFYRQWPLPLRAFLYTILFFLLMAGISNATQEFIYFAF
jgi:D-alanyl-lipoteichoic acid acyltransferase DltB (MBOAT superfamily)